MREAKKKSVPWRPRRLPPEEAKKREWIAGRFPGCAAGILLSGFSANPRVGRHRIFFDGISADPVLDSTPCVFAAIAGIPSPQPQRAVIAIPLELARGIVDTVLGRESRNLDGALTSGEEGSLLYILDRIGGDWIAAGGERFVLGGFLADGEQVADYLGANPVWKTKCRIEGEEINGSFGVLFSYLGAGPSRPPALSDIVLRTGSWPVTVNLSTGWSRLAADELESVEEGDLIYLDAGSHPELESPNAYLCLSSGRWSRGCRWLDRRRIEITSEGPSEVQMETKVKGEGEVQADLVRSLGRDTGSLEVVVRVEVGEVRMTVEKAAGLVPGRVLRLDREVGSEVNLKVGEKLIGRGELVEHEGALAVEVLEVI